VATGGNITPGGTQPAADFNWTQNNGHGPNNPAAGNLTLNTANLTAGSTLLSVAAGTVNNPSLTFALGNTVSGNTVTLSSSEIVVTGGTANTINLGVGGNSTVAINDLVGASLQLNLAYTLIQGNNTTFEDAGSSWSSTGGAGLTAFNGTISNLSGDQLFQITGGLSLLPAGTPNNFFSNWYGGSVLIYDATDNSIDVEVVPEPGTWMLMLGGLGTLILWQRRSSS